MGVLYVAVIAMWALVIVPAYLKRHDRRELEKSFRAPLTQQLRQQAVQRARPALTPSQRAFVRRRRVMMVLLTAFVVSVLGGITGAWSPYVVAAPVVGIAAFLAAAVKYASTPATARPVHNAMPTPQRTTAAVPLAPPASPFAWRPQETPLPTYLSAQPAAQRRGAQPWTAAEMLEQAAARKAQIERELLEAHMRSAQMRDLVQERAARAARAADEAAQANQAQRAVGD